MKTDQKKIWTWFIKNEMATKLKWHPRIPQRSFWKGVQVKESRIGTQKEPRECPDSSAVDHKPVQGTATASNAVTATTVSDVYANVDAESTSSNSSYAWIA